MMMRTWRAPRFNLACNTAAVGQRYKILNSVDLGIVSVYLPLLQTVVQYVVNVEIRIIHQ